MRRALFAAVILATGQTASFSQACSLPTIDRPGDTFGQGTQRFVRQYQDGMWADADVVFVGSARKIEWSGDVLKVEVVPRVSLKGELGDAPISYSPDTDKINCFLHDLPTVTYQGIYFASRATGGQIEVTGMLDPANVQDSALVDRYFQVLGIEPYALGPPQPQRPSILEYWPWLIAVSVLSLGAGVLIGRTGKSRSQRKSLS